MGRKSGQTFGKQASIFKLKENKKLDDERPDPKDNSFFQDEVDEFHQAKEKVPLRNIRGDSPASSDEEVYKVDVDSEDEGSDAYEEMDEKEVDEDDQDGDLDLEDMKSDIEEDNDENNYLPSADNWGKQKKSFYNTDYVDKDYGGYLSESDEEAAKLEEIEAKTMQKRLTEHMTEDDFILGQTKQSTKSATKVPSRIEVSEDVDVSKLSETEKLEYVKQRNPELLGIVEDFKAKYEIVEDQLRPIVEAIKSGKIPATDRLSLIQYRFEAYSNYLLNVNFYFLLKASQTSLKNHPIIDRIMEWRKVVDVIDQKCEHLTEDLKYLSDQLRNSDENTLSSVDFIVDQPITDSNPSAHAPKGTSKKKSNLVDEEVDKEQFYDFENCEETEDGKRAATYQILKNKGTTPKRKKEDRNPRVKHRRKFQKALHKKRSQVPDVKRELKKYGGEERGIKPNVIKSVKLR